MKKTTPYEYLNGLRRLEVGKKIIYPEIDNVPAYTEDFWMVTNEYLVNPPEIYDGLGWILSNELIPSNEFEGNDFGWVLGNLYSAPSILDGYWEFDGVDDMVQTPINEITTSGDVTISFEYEGNNVARAIEDYILGQHHDSNFTFNVSVLSASHSTYQNKLRYYRRVNDIPLKSLFIVSTSTVPTTGKHTYTITIDYLSGASTGRIFIDGVDDSATVVNNTLDSPTHDMTENIMIGKLNTDYIGNRSLSNIIIYNKIISDADITKLYNKDYTTMIDKPDNKDVCVAWYRANEAPGSELCLEYSGNNRQAFPIDTNNDNFFNRI